MPRKREFAEDPQPYFEARSEAQEAALEVIKNNDVTFLLGCAGTGKTHVALYSAIADMYEHNVGKKKQIQKIYITRPIVEAGESLGYIPGSIAEKTLPYMLPIYTCIDKIVHNSKKFIEDNIVVAPLAYLRGTTFENCVAILDEAQNCKRSQFVLFLSRLGHSGKLVVCADESQSDIGRASGLVGVVNDLVGESGIGIYRFPDTSIVRHPLVGKMLKRLTRPMLMDN